MMLVYLAIGAIVFALFVKHYSYLVVQILKSSDSNERMLIKLLFFPQYATYERTVDILNRTGVCIAQIVISLIVIPWNVTLIMCAMLVTLSSAVWSNFKNLFRR